MEAQHGYTAPRLLGLESMIAVLAVECSIPEKDLRNKQKFKDRAAILMLSTCTVVSVKVSHVPGSINACYRAERIKHSPGYPVVPLPPVFDLQLRRHALFLQILTAVFIFRAKCPIE